MNENNLLENPIFESYWLSHANADTIFQWLKKQQPGYITEEITEALLERHESLIKLGLALYCKLSDEAALSLYRNGDTTIKKAVLAGPSVAADMLSIFRGWWVSKSGVLRELLQSFDENLGMLEILLSNRHIPIDVLINLYRRGIPTNRYSQPLTDSHFRGLTDDQWIKAIARTISNPVLSNSYYREHMLSSMHRHVYHPYDGCSVCKMFEAAWNLFALVPVNDLSSYVLAHLGKILAPYGDGRITSGGGGSIPRERSKVQVLKDIKRWEKAGSDDKDGYFRDCRIALGRLLEEDALKDGADVGLRQAYYLNLSWKKPDEVREAFQKDKDKFLDVAVENQSLYLEENIRSELRECCWEYWSGCPNDDLGIHLRRFEEMSDSLERQHPEWFADPGDDPPFHQISDLNLRAEERLVFLQKQIKAISKELIGIQSENDEDKTSLIDKIKIVLNQSTQLILSKFLSTMIWTALIAAVLVGIILHVFR